MWARVGQVLRGKAMAPCVAALFYKLVVQAVLLYGSETWNLTKATLVQLEGSISELPIRWPRNTARSGALTVSESITAPRMFSKSVVSAPSRSTLASIGIL